MSLIASIFRRLAVVIVVGIGAARALDALRQRMASRRARRGGRVLPSLFDRHPHATAAPRRRIGLRSVPLDQIVGTLRHPSQNTDDFLPLPQLRGRNWAARWQRLRRAADRLAILPPVDLVKVGDDYWVADGHNRVAAARLDGAAEIDADVTELLVPGTDASPPVATTVGSLIDEGDVRHAASGNHSRAFEHRPRSDELTRTELADLLEEQGGKGDQA